MNECTRRQFIENALLSVALSLVSGGSSANISLPGDSSGIKNSLGMEEELRLVLKVWNVIESISPEEYLASALAKYKCDIGNISNLIKRDFLVGDVVDVHGLTLSRTEAAFLAFLAK